MPRLSFSDGLAVLGIVASIVLVALDKAGKLKRPLPVVLLVVAALMTLPLALGNDWVMGSTGLLRLGRDMGMLFAVGLIFFLLIVWTTSHSTPEAESRPSTTREPKPTPRAPSFLFAFGVPLGENDSPVWVMMLKHYGPDQAYNCDIEFIDEDRKNIEHQWLVAHPGSSFLPPGGVAGESHKRIQVAEAGPLGESGFQWEPLDPNNQHYTVNIICRDGVFVEKWQVTRVDGGLRSKLVIERGAEWIKRNPTSEPGVFRCVDPEFVSTALAVKVLTRKRKPINPGWKPRHMFDIPVAIIDPNGHLQILTGIKLPDGSQKTDFGCWNVLTRHFGDATP